MLSSTRRGFIQQATALLAATGLFTSFTNNIMKKREKNIFIHHVYFWLKNPDNAEDRAKLLEGLEKLAEVKSIRSVHIGKPAPTNREVIDSSYAFSWMTTFKTAADQDSYQVDPIHLDFVKNYSHLWSKVIVYDSIDV
ncbi:MAG: Dabb family protein [Saprospiraceae bacterium]